MKNILKRGHGTYEIIQVSKDGRHIPSEISAHLFDLGESGSCLPSRVI